MLKVKRLDLFMLKTFLPLFAMTFCICLFIVMMQFLWKYIDDLVGKGLGIDVVGELFFYAALKMTPLALPLSILLASLMTFGNLAEHFELTAIKSSGISLTKVMKPLLVLITLIAIGAFFFQNDVLPKVQVKMYTLLISIKQTSPTLDIPENTVYTQIPGYNLLVERKDKKTDMLYGVLIYDVSSAVAYPRIVAADSGRLSTTPDKKHLILQLYHGNWYEQMNTSTANNVSEISDNLYRRETFDTKEIIIAYDDNFTRIDDKTMENQYVGKNISQLQATIDSVQLKVDSLGTELAQELKAQPIVGVPMRRAVMSDTVVTYEKVPEIKLDKVVDINELISTLSPVEQRSVYNQAVAKALSTKQNFEFRAFQSKDDNFVIRRHKIEMHQKFTLSLACIIFFLIGAPLGAIVRRGGLGYPIVISVVLFIFYYVIDNSGYKLARDGRWAVWAGVWLSSAVLLPLGLFLTKKATNDSAVFNSDAYVNFFRRLLGLRGKRDLKKKEVIIEETDTQLAVNQCDALVTMTRDFLEKNSKTQSYVKYWKQGYDTHALGEIDALTNALVSNLSNSRSQQVLNKASELPVMRHLLVYRPAKNAVVGYLMMALFPIGLPVYLIGIRYQKLLKNELKTTESVAKDIQNLLTEQQDTSNI